MDSKEEKKINIEREPLEPGKISQNKPIKKMSPEVSGTEGEKRIENIETFPKGAERERIPNAPSATSEVEAVPKEKENIQDLSDKDIDVAPGIENLISYALMGEKEEKEAIVKAKKIFENEPFLIDRFHDLLIEKKQREK